MEVIEQVSPCRFSWPCHRSQTIHRSNARKSLVSLCLGCRALNLNFLNKCMIKDIFSLPGFPISFFHNSEFLPLSLLKKNPIGFKNHLMVLREVVRNVISIAKIKTKWKAHYWNCVHCLIKLEVVNRRKGDYYPAALLPLSDSSAVYGETLLQTARVLSLQLQLQFHTRQLSPNYPRDVLVMVSISAFYFFSSLHFL